MIGRIFIFAGVLMMLIGLAAHIHHESKLYDARMNHNEIQLERVLGEMEYPIDVIKAPNQFPHFEHSYLLIDANEVTWRTGEVRFNMPHKLYKRKTERK